MAIITYSNSQNFSVFKEEFHAFFQFLKLEVVLKEELKNSSLKEKNKGENFKAKKFVSSFLQITEEMSVEKLEKLFKEQYDIHLRVFRKSGNNWLETNLTSDWSLKRQNEEGNELKLFMRDKFKFKNNRNHTL